MSFLSVVTLVVAMAVPMRAIAAPMMPATHCAACLGNVSMPGKAPGHATKLLPCGPAFCVAAMAAILPAPGPLDQRAWRLTRYAAAPHTTLSGRHLVPDPLPP